MKAQDFEKLIQEHLHSLEDVELILLKGHLVIEQLLTELLEQKLEAPERLKAINPMFSKKLEMYLAITGNSIISEGLESVLKDLNSLRNKLAHDLKHPQFDQLLTEWVQRASRLRMDGLNKQEVIKQQLIAGVSFIAAFLSGAIHAGKIITNQSSTPANNGGQRRY